MSHAWFIRIDGAFHDVSGMLIHFVQKSEQTVFYEHPANPDKGNGIHCHGIYKNASFAKQTFYDAAAKLFPVRKKGEKLVKYSCVQSTDLDHAIQYMSKGKFDPVYNNSFETNYINNMKLLGYDKKDKQETTDKTLIKKRITMWDLILETVAEYTQEYIEEVVPEELCEDPNKPQLKHRVKYHNLHKIAVKIAHKHMKGSHDRMIMNIMEAASTRLDYEDQWLRIKHHFVRRLI